MELYVEDRLHKKSKLFRILEPRPNTVKVELREANINEQDLKLLVTSVCSKIASKSDSFCFKIDNRREDNYLYAYTLECLRHARVPFSLKLVDSDFERNEMCVIEGLLQYNTHLTGFDLSSSIVINEKFAFFLHALSKNNTVKTFKTPELDSYERKITNELCQLFSENKTLETLKLTCIEDVKFTNEVTEALISNTTLTKLGFGSCGVDSEYCAPITEVLRRNNTLRVLSLKRSEVSSADMHTIIASMTYNTSLVKLNLSHNSCKRDGFLSLVTLLQHNTTLQILDLSQNSLEIPEDIPYTPLFTHGLGALTHLHLAYCNLPSKEITELGLAMKTNTTVVFLDLKYNRFSEENGRVFADMLVHNTTIETLYLECTGIDENGFLAITEGISKNNTLLVLHINYQSYPNYGLFLLGFQTLLNPNSNLIELHIDFFYDTKEEFENMLNCLNLNGSLTSLKMSMFSEYDIRRRMLSIIQRNIHNKKMKETTLFERLLENTSQSELTKQTFFNN